MSDKPNCPVCRMPMQNAGTITQWIVACQCQTDARGKMAPAPGTCQSCGKQVEEARSGSMTQWIFGGGSRCTCRQPTASASIARTQRPSLSPQERDDLPKGFPLQRYEPLKLLGTGATGRVYMCDDILLKKIVAVKILHVLSPDFLVAFQREAKATDKLNHPGIVKVLDFGINEDAPYMVLECIDGISLATRLEEGPLSISDAMELFGNVAQALQYAHEAGVFHRDLKPSNILLVDGRVRNSRLIDFGVAHLMAASQDTTTGQAKTLAGTPAYMSPDQIDGRSFDSRSEVYSFGCVLFEALTGEPPFQADSALELMAVHVTEPPPLSLLDDKGVQLRLRKCIEKCLAKQPEDRWSNFRELSAELAACGGDNQEAKESDTTSSSKKQSSFRSIAILLGCIVIATPILFLSLSPKNQSEPIVPAKPTRFSESPLTEKLATNLQHSIDKKATSFLLLDDVTDSELHVFENYNRAIDISLSGESSITNKGLYYLRNQKRLVTLNLEGTSVSDLSLLKNLSSLETLNLSGTQIRNEDMIHLASLPKLINLNVRDTKVNYEGLKRLTNLPHLVNVQFTPPPIESEARELERLYHSNPKCEWLKQSYIGLLTQNILNKSYCPAPLEHIQRFVDVTESKNKHDFSQVENLRIATKYCRQLGAVKQAKEYSNRAIEAARELKNVEYETAVSNEAVNAAIKENDLDEAERLTKAQMASAHRTKSTAGARHAAFVMATACGTAKQTRREIKWWKEYLKYADGEPGPKANATFYTGMSLASLNEHAEAITYFKDCINQLKKFKDDNLLVNSLLRQSQSEAKLGRKQQARALLMQMRDVGEATSSDELKTFTRRAVIGQLIDIGYIKDADNCSRHLIQVMGDSKAEQQYKSETCSAMIVTAQRIGDTALRTYWTQQAQSLKK